MLTREKLEEVLKQLGIPVETDGKHFVHSAPGRYAPLINTVVTLDEDGSAATILCSLVGRVAAEKRPALYELFNLVHGQNLWNVRFHLDDDGRILAIGRFSLWGRPFHGVQFGDILFSLLVTADRIWPCVNAIVAENQAVMEAFALFFHKQTSEGEAEDDS